MKAEPLLISWHNDNAPIYSTHFEPHGKGRLATAGGDNNVRLWRVDKSGDGRKITYLSTLIKHTQAVNVVRFAPRGEMLASAGDDGNVLLWVPAESLSNTAAFGEEGLEDKETWRIKHMCRSSGSEIYDLAWSPDGIFFVTGSMDNIARVYNAHSGQMVRQIAEHNHYVQGVAWDPLNEYLATQSSDRACHVYSLKTKDGQFSLTQHNKVSRMDFPARRISSNSPAPPDPNLRVLYTNTLDANRQSDSPAPSVPGTPTSLSTTMNPPPSTHSRRSSFGSSPALRRSASPAPSMPLPAVCQVDMHSPNFNKTSMRPITGSRSVGTYANETYNSFFRRLTFAPDGSLLLTPAGQYKVGHQTTNGNEKPVNELINTVYIYTRAGLNRPPIAHLPGHKKPSIAVKCSPIFYTLRNETATTENIAIDTSSAEEPIGALPEAVLPARPASAIVSHPSVPALASTGTSKGSSSSRPSSRDHNAASLAPASSLAPNPYLSLPYRIIYAVATQDSVLVYDSQQGTPLVVVSNLHYATFTDLTWSMDGLTLVMSSSDGFCSTLSFSPEELGQTYTGRVPNFQNPSPAVVSPISTPTQLQSSTLSERLPTGSSALNQPMLHTNPSGPIPSSSTITAHFPTSGSNTPVSGSSTVYPTASSKAPSLAPVDEVPATTRTPNVLTPGPAQTLGRGNTTGSYAKAQSIPPLPPPSPTRSNSVSSVATETSQAFAPNLPGLPAPNSSHALGASIESAHPTPSMGQVPSISAMSTTTPSGLPWTATPPQTPLMMVSSTCSTGTSVLAPSRPASESDRPATNALGKRDASESSDTDDLGAKSRDGFSVPPAWPAPTRVPGQSSEAELHQSETDPESCKAMDGGPPAKKKRIAPTPVAME